MNERLIFSEILLIIVMYSSIIRYNLLDILNIELGLNDNQHKDNYIFKKKLRQFRIEKYQRNLEKERIELLKKENELSKDNESKIDMLIQEQLKKNNIENKTIIGKTERINIKAERRDIKPERRDIKPERRETKIERRETKIEGRDIKPERRDIKPERRETKIERRETKIERREMKVERKEIKIERREMKVERKETKIERDKMKPEENIIKQEFIPKSLSPMEQYINKMKQEYRINFHPTYMTKILNQYSFLFKKFVENKTVAIVGPAKSIIGTGKGKTIDKFDIVIRLNKALPLPMNISKDIGTKTTIIYNSLNVSDYPGQNILDTNLYKQYGVQFVCCSYPYNGVFVNDINNYINRYQFDIPFRCIEHGKYYAFENKIKTRPYTGTSAIMDILSYKVKALYITGIDFYNTYNFKKI